MIRLNKPYKKAFVFFFFSVLILLILLNTAPRKTSTTDTLHTAIQMIENSATPILLSGQVQSGNTQLSALIQNTQIAEIRLIEQPSSDILARALNVTGSGEDLTLSTQTKTVVFDNNEIGLVEIDIWSSPQALPRTFFSWTFLTAVLIGGSMTLIVSAQAIARRYLGEDHGTSTHPNNTKPLTPRSTMIELDGPQLLIIIKIAGAPETAEHQDLSSEGNTALSAQIQQLAELYKADLFSVSSRQLAFNMAGKANRQHIQQALVFAWGVTQLSLETLHTGEQTPTIRSWVVDGRELEISPTETYSYLVELESLCATNELSTLSVSSALADRVDDVNFEITEEGTRFFPVKGASTAIKRLWENQRSRLSHE